MSDDSETENSLLIDLSDLVDIEIGRRDKRPMCGQCKRPKAVCWCKNIQGCKISTMSKVFLFQHPHEEKRCLRTAPILETLLPVNHFLELKGKRFTTKKFPILNDIYNDPNTIVLYPGEKAISVEQLTPVGQLQAPYNIIILDGTWQQAKSIFYRNPCLHSIKQVCLTGHTKSHYVIRTQPTDDALSTVETAAVVLSTLENDWSIYSQLIYPLKLICDYQVNHGAVLHDSKEKLILSGRYKKPMGKRTYKKLRKCGVKNGDISLQEILTIAEKCRNQEGVSSDSDNSNDLKDLDNMNNLSLTER